MGREDLVLRESAARRECDLSRSSERVASALRRSFVRVGPRSVFGRSDFGRIRRTRGFPRTLQFMVTVMF